MAEGELTTTPSTASDEREERTQQLVYGAIVALTALGLAASAALLVDYLRPLPLFCSESGGCAQLRATSYSHIGPIPTPAFGVAGYSVLAVFALLRGDTARFLHLMTATFGALFAAYYLFLQVSLHTFCGFCMTVDITSIVLLSLVLMRVRTEADGPAARGSLAIGAMFAAAIGVPFLSHALVKTKVPEVIAQEITKTPPGEVTIVDFVDFECPFCRQTSIDFEPVLTKYAGRYRLVRKQVPLSRHPHAATAARAAACGETFGKGDEMAAKLFAQPVDQLDEDGCVSLAQSLGIDADAFRACTADPRTQKKIDADAADFKAAQGHALPTIWIGNEVIEGMQGRDRLQNAMDKAISELGS
jgi:uncharacterized membrane protein/predicted DsbA family dithiol-disulfide isomerase